MLGPTDFPPALWIAVFLDHEVCDRIGVSVDGVQHNCMITDRKYYIDEITSLYCCCHPSSDWETTYDFPRYFKIMPKVLGTR